MLSTATVEPSFVGQKLSSIDVVVAVKMNENVPIPADAGIIVGDT